MKVKLWVATLVLTLLMGWPVKSVVAADLPSADQRYWDGYRVCRNDVRQHAHHQWQDPFIAAGYRRGMREEQEAITNSSSEGQTQSDVDNGATSAGSQEENRSQTTGTLPLSVA